MAWTAVLVVLIAAVASWGLIGQIFPWLERYALARPNARSSHKTPTAQGGGAAVIPVTLLVTWSAVLLVGVDGSVGRWQLAAVTLVAVVLAVLGAFDDIRPLPVVPRLAAQVLAAVVLVQAMPDGAHALPLLPRALEFLILVVGLIWFINLTNFMDGIDWMTVVQTVPVSAGLAALAVMGALPPTAGLLALALAGALLGFAPYNRHVARLFLGDVGSLAIGALVGWMLILLAAGGHLAAALLLPLYYLADATVTLYRRWRRGERLSQAHRSHFYQRATAHGFTVPEVTGRVAALNGALVLLALASALFGSTALDVVLLAAGAALTGLLLAAFERGRDAARAS
ncbi:MAG: glycosyl transferase [Hyphomicrobiaceae bacterium]